MDLSQIRLTRTVKKSGCAAKLPAGELMKALSKVRMKNRPELVVGPQTFDDAALWDLGDGRYMVNTLYFFTPVVDDAYEFGAIAAANAMSDVYAMGGEPSLALTILAFPSSTLPYEMLEPLLKGAVDKIQEGGACVGGGHSIDDDHLKLGFAVTGFVDKDRAWTNSGAKPGDVLILTKALGTGTLISSHKNGDAENASMRGAVDSMMKLNRIPELIEDIPVAAATDVTGFSLAGHGVQMASASNVSLRIDQQKLPALEGAIDCLARGVLNKAHKTNLNYTEGRVHYAGDDEALKWLTVDPQTSGGLLLSIPDEHADRALTLIQEKFPAACKIGVVAERAEFQIFFE